MENQSKKGSKMLKISSYLTLTVFTISFQAIAARDGLDQTCGYDRVSFSSQKLEQRPNPRYALINQSTLSRFDSDRSGRRVHYFHRTGGSSLSLPVMPWRNSGQHEINGHSNLYHMQQNFTNLGTDSVNAANGHTSKRFTPSSTGKHQVIAAYVKDYTLSGPIFDSYVSALFCVVHEYFVHGLPTLRENLVSENTTASGDTEFKANLTVSWAPFSEAIHTNRARRINWAQQTVCVDSGNFCYEQNSSWQNITTVNSDQDFSRYFMPGRYNLRATIDDGVSTVTKYYYIDNSNATGSAPCPECAPSPW